MRVVFGFTLLIALNVVHADQNFEIKGMKLGTQVDCRTLDEIDKRDGEFYGRSTQDGCWPTEHKIGAYMVAVSFLDASNQRMVLGLRPDGILARITLASEKEESWSDYPWTYDSAVAAFSGKYGAPDEVITTTANNAFGAEFVQRRTVWKDGTEILVVGDNLSKVGRVTVQLIDSSLSLKPTVSDDI